jgi:hypothetical protein
MFSPKLPCRHTVNQTVLILGLNPSVSEQEIQSGKGKRKRKKESIDSRQDRSALQ